MRKERTTPGRPRCRPVHKKRGGGNVANKTNVKEQNSTKAAATLRRLLKAEEKDLPEMNLEFDYECAEEKTACKFV